jgi:glycerophosphoryl diester phosphodiesterase
MKKPVIIAHRGASAYAPENTMAAFKKALEMKAGGIEIDVHLTKDGYPVVVHDEKLGRTSNGTGLIKDKTLEELKELDFGSWFSEEFKNQSIPTLDEVMELISTENILFNIELKSGAVLYHDIERIVVDMVKEYEMEERVIISSFNHYSLLEVKKIAPEIKIGFLYSATRKGSRYVKSMNPVSLFLFRSPEKRSLINSGINSNSIISYFSSKESMK